MILTTFRINYVEHLENLLHPIELGGEIVHLIDSTFACANWLCFFFFSFRPLNGKIKFNTSIKLMTKMCK